MKGENFIDILNQISYKDTKPAKKIEEIKF
jgi:hypothetical protein